MQPAEQKKTKRADPSIQRPTSGGEPGYVRNARPDRAYKLANPLDDRSGLPRLIDKEWTKIDATKDKERVYSGRVMDNGDVSYLGQILVWLPKEKYEEYQAEKQRLGDMRFTKSRGAGGIDGVKGLDGRPASDIIPQE
jgi:hypothetical protein